MRPSVCYNCGESGHKVQNCDKIDKSGAEGMQNRRPGGFQGHGGGGGEFQSRGGFQGGNEMGGENAHPMQQRPRRDISEITCFRCGQKGHYAARCDQAQQGGDNFNSYNQQGGGIQTIGTTGGGYRGGGGGRYRGRQDY